jgi:4-hydroxy-tetrahydrodipicolinate synthase
MIKGSMVALVTPMKSTGVIDWEALSRLVEWHVESGTAAIVAVGTSGESATLEVPEHCAVIKAVVEKVGGRIPVIAGTGANSTAEAITLTKAAKDAGADAALLVTPYYNKPTQEGLYLHHKAIAEAVDIDQILYNVPGRTACDMQPETVIRLAEIGNIIGIKEATGDLSRVDVLVNQTPDDFALYSGDDATAMDFILAGGHGDISVTANVAPQEMAEMCALALAGDRAGAEAMNKPLLQLHERLFLESNPIPVKWALAKMGLIDLGIRLPLTVLDMQYHSSVREAFQQAGISLK